VVHRDVKPANVLMTDDDQPVLADFGLAKLLQGSSLKSMTGVTTGTPAYMAPEQVTGSRVGPAADRYSLATIAYEMLTGVIPFDGEALMELLYAQVHREPPAPSSREPALGPQVDAVVARGLAKEPAARWESATAFVDALAAALSGAPAPGAAKPMAPVVASTVPLTAAAVAERVAARPQPATVAMAYPIPGAAPAVVPQTKRKSRKRLIALIAAAAIVVLLIGTIALLALGSPTLTLSSSTVAPGEDIVVSATRVPANQAGEIQLHSTLRTFPFKANASGNVAIDITVPLNIGFGDHLVALCYTASCHAQKTLHVISRVAFASPTPIGNVTPGTTPSASPRQGASPAPGSTPPTSRPTSTPTSTPTSAPKPTPSPSPKPTPTPSASVTIVSISQLGSTRVVFHYVYGGSTVAYVCQGGTCHSAGSVTVAAGADVPVSFKTPVGILVTAAPLVGPAYVYTSCCGATSAVNVGA
jgi:hypothetical protein